MDIQQLAWRYFSKKNGYALRPDVIAYLLERIQQSHVPADNIAKLMEYIADNFAAIVGKSVEIVDRKTLEEVVEKLFKAKITITSSYNVDPRDFCHVISTSLLGKWRYNERNNTFEKANAIDGPRQHYSLIRKRLSILNPTLTLHNLNSLKGKEHGTAVSCLGMIQEFKEGQLYLEDLDEAVKLEITKSCRIDYTVCKNFYVLVNGIIQESGNLLAKEIKAVPSLNIEEHKRLLPDIDYTLVAERLEKKNEIETVEYKSDGFVFCFINDAWLDNSRSKAKFSRLLESLNNVYLVVFIFCGQLFSPSFSGDRSQIIKDVALMTSKTFPKSLLIISHSSEVTLFPQPALPDSLFKPLIDHNVRYILAQNPSRIAYCTQEIVVFDDSLCRQLYRNSLSRLGSAEELCYDQCKREVFCYFKICRSTKCLLNRRFSPQWNPSRMILRPLRQCPYIHRQTFSLSTRLMSMTILLTLGLFV